VQQQSKHVWTSSRMTRRSTDQPSGNSQGHHAAVGQIGRRHVEHAGNQTSHQNGEEKGRLRHSQRYETCCHQNLEGDELLFFILDGVPRRDNLFGTERKSRWPERLIPPPARRYLLTPSVGWRTSPSASSSHAAETAP